MSQDSRRGRPPLRAEHVERLSGSQRAKLRLRVILETLEGRVTIPEACRQLGIGETRFHQLRHRCLQQAVEWLEPRPAGRRPAPPEAAAPQQLDQLQAELQAARHELALAEARHELQAVQRLPLKRGRS